jgi:hypothetical protein
LIGKKVIFVAAGHEYSMAVVNDGSVWAWGLNGSGQLGMGHTMDQNTPQKLRVISIDGREQKVTSITCGRASTLFITEEGHVLVTGESLFGLPPSTRPIRVPPALLTNGGRATLAAIGEKWALTFVEPGPKQKRKSAIPTSVVPDTYTLLAAGGILQHPLVAGLLPDDDDSSSASSNPWSFSTSDTNSPRGGGGGSSGSGGGDATDSEENDEDSSRGRRSPRAVGVRGGRGGRGRGAPPPSSRGGRGGGRGYYSDDLPRGPSGGRGRGTPLLGSEEEAPSFGVSFWGGDNNNSNVNNNNDIDFEVLAGRLASSGSGPSSPSRSPRGTIGGPSSGFNFVSPSSSSPSFPVSLPTAPTTIPPLPSSPMAAPSSASSTTTATVGSSPSPFSATGNLFNALEAAASSASSSSSSSSAASSSSSASVMSSLFASPAPNSSLATPARSGSGSSSSSIVTPAPSSSSTATAAAAAPVRAGSRPTIASAAKSSLMATPITFGGMAPVNAPGAPVKPANPNASSSSSSSTSAAPTKPLVFPGLPPLPPNVAQVARGNHKRTCLGAFPTALLMMGHMDRLANSYWLSSIGSQPTAENQSNPRLLVEPYAVEVSRVALGRLLHMANKYGHRLLDGGTDYSNIEWYHPYLFMALLRLLRTNFRRLLLSNVDMESIRGDGRSTGAASCITSIANSNSKGSK